MHKRTTEYLCWLLNKAQIIAEGPDGYLELAKILQDTPFVPIIDMDENRCEDGMRLRNEWASDEIGDKSEMDYALNCIDYELGSEYCTMLELILVLARKIHYHMIGSQHEASIGKWFIEILCNCGLDEFNNEKFEDDPVLNEQAIRDILRVNVTRTYDWDGENGGFFPLMYPPYDQRVVELVIQMNNYEEENYDIL